MKTIAIVPAAGSSKRFGAKKNKAFHVLLDRPVVFWVLDKLQAVEAVDEIIPVFKKEDISKCLELIRENGITKAKKIAPGGAERQDSVFHALMLINEKDSIVLIHDGVRPLVEKSLIEKAIYSLGDYDGVIPAIPLRDTIKKVKEGIVKKTVNREELMAIQTPQVFRIKTIFNAYSQASEKERLYTDDASMVEKAGGKIKIIEGDFSNIKITTQEDLEYAEFLLRRRKDL